METITLKIDGAEVTTKKGATVLEAARKAGIYIPTLCYDPDLKPYGGCRLCIVEIDGLRGLPTACTTPATQGMVVQTVSPLITETRRDIVSLLLADYPSDCRACSDGHLCDLHCIASELGLTNQPFRRFNKSVPVDSSNPFFERDLNYCILCGKCVRTCDEIVGANAIDLSARGYTSLPSTFGDRPIVKSNCRSCGECVERCPTGALLSKNSLSPTSEVSTTCPYCGVGCQLYLGIREGQIVNVRGNPEGVSNKGDLCVKGRYGIPEFVHHPERLTEPLIKKNGKFEATSWDEALELVAQKLSHYSGEEMAVISSAKCTNEDNYVIQKLARSVLKTNNIDHCARL